MALTAAAWLSWLALPAARAADTCQGRPASIVGTVVYALAQEALGGLVHLSLFKHYLLSSQFDAWHGLFQTPIFWTAIVRAVWVSAIFAAVPLAAAFAVFMRRDVAGE